MRAAMSIDLKQMSSLLYWFIPSMLYFNVLFLDNSVAVKPHYIDSETTELYDIGAKLASYPAIENSILIKNIEFTGEVNHESFNSLIAFRNVTLFMADTFKFGNRITSIQIVNGDLKRNSLSIKTYERGHVVDYSGIYYCQSQPEAYATVLMHIYQDRTIQFLIHWGNPMNCPITLKITKGIYKGGEDGSGTVTDEELIYIKSIPVPNSVHFTVLTLIPSYRCQAQTTESNCTTQSIRNVTCTWCPKIDMCVLVASLCFLPDETKITQSYKTEPSNVIYIVIIVLACALIGFFIIGILVWMYYFASH
uniref:Egg protein CP111 n=1 Tax=Schistosoma japonicum TaxID=6182 RepID=C1LHY6_SCHJA|nr:Egg protein CP111 [Schistosoma japonicum]